MPVVEIIPSLKKDKTYEARLWIARDNTSSPLPLEVIWSAGLAGVFRVQRSAQRTEDENFCIAIDYSGPMFVQAELHFEGDAVAVGYVYARRPRAW